MNIAFIAQDQKKELMASFCIAYKAILQRHSLFATGTTGSIINNATGLNVYKFSPGHLGGEQQIKARVTYNEIDMLIYFRDISITGENETNTNNIFKLCDANNIPFATNIATAEVLIKGLERGDLAWRDLVNPQRK